MGETAVRRGRVNYFLKHAFYFFTKGRRINELTFVAAKNNCARKKKEIMLEIFFEYPIVSFFSVNYKRQLLLCHP